jgi:hypothetical protein
MNTTFNRLAAGALLAAVAAMTVAPARANEPGGAAVRSAVTDARDAAQRIAQERAREMREAPHTFSR